MLCCLVYSFAYVGRYSYNANIGAILAYYGVTRADAGMVSTFFFFSYGAGQLIHALLCKFYPKKYVIPSVLLLSSILNLSLFFLPSFACFKYLWLLNGICQSVLWPVLTMTIGETIDGSLMKRAVLLMSMSVLIGTFLSYGGGALFNLFGGFRFSFLLGTVFMTAIGLIWLLSYSVLTADSSVERRDDISTDASSQKRSPLGALVGLLAVCALFAVVDNLVKDGLNTWTPVILKEQFGFEDSISIVLTLVLPVFGVFGSVVALQINRFIKDFRGLIGFFYLLLSGCLLGLILALRVNAVILTLVCFGIISCLTHGINSVLTSIMPLSLREQANSGFLAGLLNSFCYVGSTVSAYGLGKLADRSGWGSVMWILLAISGSATLLAGGVTAFKLLHKHTQNGVKEKK